ncbi:kunitz-type serine protease inhibitor 6-like [Mizuhopecten yessoensis]|uniref:kunitz-type serine protease inhibitor 6-like n=1 Tax=Mizuhopecten yessoensis TaxID=6573 RepID=UPI000B4597FC|nr:kunitz-type serine protease inhibitor 6-like [Mizuhopecten yessoensis]
MKAYLVCVCLTLLLASALATSIAPLPDRSACLEPMMTGMCLAYFQRYYYNTVSQTCGQFVYGGCGGNQNNFYTQAECEHPNPSFQVTDMKTFLVCVCLSLLVASALASTTTTTMLHDNSACSEPKFPGPCKGLFYRFYYDNDQMDCLEFIYGGCGGNRNNFLTLQHCQSTCKS